MTLAVGDQVATLKSSTALVTFFEGSELEIGGDTTIVLKEITASGNEVHVLVENVVGLAIVRVQAFANPNSDFKLQNPGGSVVALARGSSLISLVLPDGSVAAGFFDCVKTPCSVAGFGLTVQGFGEGLIACNASGNCQVFPLGDIYTDPDAAIQSIIKALEEQNKNNETKPDDSEDGGYQDRTPSSPLLFQVLRSRLQNDVDPLAATGAVLAVGMLGWSLIGYRPRRRR
jgi:hypothetical protein